MYHKLLKGNYLKYVTHVVVPNVVVIVADEQNESTQLGRDNKLVKGLQGTIANLTYPQRLISGHIYDAQASLSEV